MVFRNFGLTADVIIEEGNRIVLVKRDSETFKGKLAIPGGFVEENETIEQAAVREIEEETSLKVNLKELLGVYSKVDRDPRGRTATAVFIAEKTGGELKAGSDAGEVRWVNISNIDFSNMAFDHGKILEGYLRWRREKGTYWSGR